jgi:fluoride exporter
VIKTLSLLALAGACGTLARFGLQGLAQTLRLGAFPWGTLAVNSLGCFAMGVVWALGGERTVLSAGSRATLLVGFMGAFTTWSGYVFETTHLVRQAEWWLAAANILGQHALGFLLFFAGLGLGRLL